MSGVRSSAAKESEEGSDTDECMLTWEPIH